MRALAFALLLVFSLAARADDSMEPRIAYDLVEKRHTALDHRVCLTGIYLHGGARLTYSFHENVSGSVTQRVEVLRFQRERKLTADEQREIVEALLEAKVFDLAGDSGTEPNNHGHLRVRLAGRSAAIDLYSATPFPAASRIHEILLGFAKRMKVDEPEDLAAALTVSEGDRMPVRELKLTDLIQRPGDYHGKRVAVVGFEHFEREGDRLGLARRLSYDDLFEKSIWRGNASDFAAESDLKARRDVAVRVEGVFLRGPAGHFGMWPGEITRITRVEPVAK